MTIEAQPLRELDEPERRAIDDAVDRYGRFVALPAGWSG